MTPAGTSVLVRVLLEREMITLWEAQRRFDEARLRVRQGDDPAEVLWEVFGLKGRKWEGELL